MADEMEAGRELDALVAERVMGLGKPEFRVWGIDSFRDWRTPVDRPEARSSIGVIAAHTAWLRVPEYSTDIRAAWKVIEHMREQWAATENAKAGEPDAWQFDDLSDEGWAAIVVWLHHDGTVQEVVAFAPTLPLAICRAALRAIPTPPASESSPVKEEM